MVHIESVIEKEMIPSDREIQESFGSYLFNLFKETLKLPGEPIFNLIETGKLTEKNHHNYYFSAFCYAVAATQGNEYALDELIRITQQESDNFLNPDTNPDEFITLCIHRKENIFAKNPDVYLQSIHAETKHLKASKANKMSEASRLDLEYESYRQAFTLLSRSNLNDEDYAIVLNFNEKPFLSQALIPSPNYAIQLHLNNGKLVDSLNTPFDTSSFNTINNSGYASYLIDSLDGIYVFEKSQFRDQYVHSCQLMGKSQFYIGDIQVENGKLLFLTTHSKPNEYRIYQTLKCFKQYAIDLSAAKVKVAKLLDPNLNTHVYTVENHHNDAIELMYNANELYDKLNILESIHQLLSKKFTLISQFEKIRMNFPILDPAAKNLIDRAENINLSQPSSNIEISNLRKEALIMTKNYVLSLYTSGNDELKNIDPYREIYEYAMERIRWHYQKVIIANIAQHSNLQTQISDEMYFDIVARRTIDHLQEASIHFPNFSENLKQLLTAANTITHSDPFCIATVENIRLRGLQLILEYIQKQMAHIDKGRQLFINEFSSPQSNLFDSVKIKVSLYDTHNEIHVDAVCKLKNYEAIALCEQEYTFTQAQLLLEKRFNLVIELSNQMLKTSSIFATFNTGHHKRNKIIKNTLSIFIELQLATKKLLPFEPHSIIDLHAAHEKLKVNSSTLNAELHALPLSQSDRQEIQPLLQEMENVFIPSKIQARLLN